MPVGDLSSVIIEYGRPVRSQRGDDADEANKQTKRRQTTDDRATYILPHRPKTNQETAAQQSNKATTQQRNNAAGVLRNTTTQIPSTMAVYTTDTLRQHFQRRSVQATTNNQPTNQPTHKGTNERTNERTNEVIFFNHSQRTLK